MGGGLHAVWMTVYVHFGGSRVLCVAMPVGWVVMGAMTVCGATLL